MQVPLFFLEKDFFLIEVQKAHLVARMEGGVCTGDMARVHMGINLSGGNVYVSEHFLNGAKGCAMFKEMCCKTVSEHVG